MCVRRGVFVRVRLQIQQNCIWGADERRFFCSFQCTTRSNAPRWNVGYDALRHSKLFVWTRERPIAGFQRGALEPVDLSRVSWAVVKVAECLLWRCMNLVERSAASLSCVSTQRVQ